MSALRLHYVDTLDLPQLRPYRTLRRPQEHLKQGIFVAEGEKVVRRFLDSDWRVLSLLLTQEWFDAVIPAVAEQRLGDAEIFIAKKELLETIVGFPLHQGIMAVGKVPPERPLPETVASCRSPHLLVALDGLVHAENVGVVVRNCAGFGVDAVLASSTSASPYLRRAVRNSMGGVFVVPVVHVEHLASSLAGLKEQFGTRIIVADAHGTQRLDEAEFIGNICIVFGNEDSGVSEGVQAIATQRVRIPMHNAMDSLNVASASAVVLYEGRRKRPAV
jgi:tRNA G18 (ribose-2'-O)-methylase SpoU